MAPVRVSPPLCCLVLTSPPPSPSPLLINSRGKFLKYAEDLDRPAVSQNPRAAEYCPECLCLNILTPKPRTATAKCTVCWEDKRGEGEVLINLPTLRASLQSAFQCAVLQIEADRRGECKVSAYVWRLLRRSLTPLSHTRTHALYA